MGDAPESEVTPGPGKKASAKQSRRSGAAPGEGKTDRFGKWQDARREHLASTIHLVLTFSLAALGYAANLLFRPEKESASLASSVRPWVMAAMVILFLAVAAALAVNLFRLSDLRWTARGLRLHDVRQAYLKRRMVRLPEWLRQFATKKTELLVVNTGQPAEAEKELREIDRSRRREAIEAIMNARDRMGDESGNNSPAYVAFVNPETLAWAVPQQATGNEKQEAAGPRAHQPAPPPVASASPDSRQKQTQPDYEAEVRRRLKELLPPLSRGEEAITQEIRRRILLRLIAAELDSPREYCQNRAEMWGRWTWHLFPWQLALFALGVLVLAVGLCLQALPPSTTQRAPAEPAGKPAPHRDNAPAPLHGPAQD